MEKLPIKSEIILPGVQENEPFVRGIEEGRFDVVFPDGREKIPMSESVYSEPSAEVGLLRGTHTYTNQEVTVEFFEHKVEESDKPHMEIIKVTVDGSVVYPTIH